MQSHPKELSPLYNDLDDGVIMGPESLYGPKTNDLEDTPMNSTMEHCKHQRYPVRFKSIYSTDRIHIEDGLGPDISLGGCKGSLSS